MALHERFRTHTLTVTRRGRTSDGQGGWTEGWSTVGTVTGSLQPGSASEGAAADQEQALVDHLLYTDPAPTVERDDRLTIDTRTFRVVAVTGRDADGAMDHACVDLESVQRGR